MVDRVGILPTNNDDRLVIEFEGTLAGKVTWIPNNTLQREFRKPDTRRAVQLSNEATVVMQQTAEAFTALAVEPNALSWPNVAQPIFDGVRQLLLDRGELRQAELIG